jgi:glycosyltransferase involved in cell wall biosynthesis
LGNVRGRPLTGVRSLTGRGVAGWLERERPDAVLLTGLRYEFDWAAYVGAWRRRIPIWLRTETQDHAFRRPAWKAWVRSAFYRSVYARVDLALVIGQLNAEHYTRHGLPAARQVASPYCVVDRATGLTASARAELRADCRAEFSFAPDRTVILFCGKLQPKKDPGLILEALARLPGAERGRFGVLYVGSGDLEPELRRIAGRLADVPVHFAGFRNQTELVRYYLAADVLVLPSRQAGETWGLVVNEALLAGCRVVISRHVGCHAEFGGLPGVWVIEDAAPALARALCEVRASPLPPDRRETLDRYSVAAAAAGIQAAMGLRAPGVAAVPEGGGARREAVA